MKERAITTYRNHQQQKMSVEDYSRKIERARLAVKPMIDFYTEFYIACLPKIVIHPTGRIEHCYSDEEEELMAKYRKLIEELFATAMGDECEIMEGSR